MQYLQAFLWEPSYLLMDEFQVPLMVTSLNSIKDCAMAMDLICGSYTSKFQKCFGCWSKEAL